MNYEELIEKVLQGRTVNAAAKAIGVPQPSLDRYVKKEQIPDCDNGYAMVLAAGIDLAEGFRILATAKRNHKLKKQQGFVQISILPFVGGVGVVILSILCKMDEATDTVYIIVLAFRRSHPARHVDQAHGNG